MMLLSVGRTPLEYANLSELDQAMTNVINNKNLSSLEKINLYSKLLQKNLKMEQKIKANEIPTGETTAVPPETVVTKTRRNLYKKVVVLVDRLKFFTGCADH